MMSVNSPEPLTNDSVGDVSFEQREAPRKRSKVSRACDACRKKKVRCDAEYSSALQRVTKVCTNCDKVGDNCLFSRVPLKRGPSKGYIRDLVDRLDVQDGVYGPNSKPSTDQSHRPRSKSVDVAGLKSQEKISSPSSPLSQTQSKPMLHRSKFNHPSATTQPIILPPLIGNQPSKQPVKLSVPITRTHSSVSPNNAEEISDQRIQGPLWKVPYEMPNSGGTGSNVSSPNSVSGMGFDSRRSSVDSISSISTAGSRLPSLQSSISVNHIRSSPSDNEESTSGRSGTSSPRNSVSSLSSLNGRVANSLNISNAPPGSQSQHATVSPARQALFHPSPSPSQSMFSHHQPPNKLPVFPQFQFPIQQNQYSINSRQDFSPRSSEVVPLNALDYNLRAFYVKFQRSFPLLPCNENSIIQLINELQNQSPLYLEVIQIFSATLNNLINFQLVSQDLITSSLYRLLGIYPLNKLGVPVNNDVLILVFSSLVIMNYTILLKGEPYSLGISFANGIFNDYRVFEIFKSLDSAQISSLDADDVQLYFPRLYLCLHIIDNCYSLSYGTQSQLSGNVDTLYPILESTLPKKIIHSPFYFSLKLNQLFSLLLKIKDERVSLTSFESKKSFALQSLHLSFSDADYGSLFFNLLKDKFELFDTVTEVSNYLKSNSNLRYEDEDIKDHIHDYQLKVSRLVKKLTQSILSFANYVSTVSLQAKSSSTNRSYELNNPFYNLGFSQALKLIKVCKKLLDSLIQCSSDNEITSRSIKIKNDLSIASNLLIGNLNSVFNLVSSAKTSLNNHSPGTPNNVDLSGPGIICVGLLLSKLESYNLNFSNVDNPQPSAKGEVGFQAWKRDLLDTLLLVMHEDMGGWF